MNGLKNAQYVEHLLNMFNGEVNLFSLCMRDTEYELQKGRMNIVCGHPQGTKHDILAHEIAHIVDSPMSRVIKNNFGFKYFGAPRNPKTLFATISTEIRVFAIETVILEEELLIKDCSLLDNYADIAKDLGIHKQYAKKFFQSFSYQLAGRLDKFKSIQEVMIWGANLYEKTRAKYSSLDVIEAEFSRKIAHVNEHYCLILNFCKYLMNKYYHYKRYENELYFLEDWDDNEYRIYGIPIKNISGGLYNINVTYCFYKDSCTLVTDIETIRELDKIVVFL